MRTRYERILNLDALVKSRSDQLESDLGAVAFLMRKGSGERPCYAFGQDNGKLETKGVLCPTFVAYLVCKEGMSLI